MAGALLLCSGTVQGVRYAPGYREWFHQTRREKKKRQGTYILCRRRSGESDLLTADSCEACLQIGDDIIDVLGADGQADGVLVDLLLGQLLIVQLAVGGGCRVDDQTLHIRNVCQQREDLQVIDELECDLMEMANTSKSYDFILKFIERKENNFAYKEFIKSLKNLLDLKDSAMVELIKPALVGLLYEECIPVYIPAERLLISTFSNSIFSLLQAGASIPDCIKDFGSLYEKARIQYKNIDINILDIKVSFNNNGDTVYLMNENKEVKLSQTSSGIQSIIPLWIVFNQYVESKKKQILVIEEPELNLFPSTQHFLIDWIMRKMRKSNGSIVITTHSPYVLSVVDNLILAQEILKKSNKKKLVLSKIKELIPSMALIDFDDVSSYFFHSDGTVKDIRDTDIKSLGAEYIDTASDKLGYIFDELCNIERNEL